MTARGLLKWLFPPPRRPMTWRSAMPLVMFIVVFAAVCFALDFYDVVLFAAPGAFALTILAVWFWIMHMGGYGGLAGKRATIALLLRLITLGVFIAVLAQPRSVRKHETLSLVFVMDVSASIGQEASDAALEYVARIGSQKPEKDEVGLVVFGREAAVELPPDQAFPFEQPAITLQVDRDGTNLAQSLSLAAALLPEENQGRIVLISDGTATEGNLRRAVDELTARKIGVDILPIEYDYEHEVWIERLELPRFTKIGETYEATIILSSLTDGEGELILQENGRAFEPQKIEYQAGKNRYTIPIRLREPGYYEYEATIEVPRERDGWRRNNKAISYLYLRGEGKVLLVTNPDGDNRDWQTLADALRKAERSVDILDAYQVPTDPLSLLPYDAIIFANAPADTFAVTQFAAVRDAVRNQGSGFLMVGGDQSFGPGGFHRTIIEEMLPVEMDVTQRKIMPKSAMAIVLHTCEFADGNTWGKRITKQAIKVLGAQDEVGVLVYAWGGGGPTGDQWLFPLTPAGEYDRLATLINGAQIGDMPMFHPTMQMALTGLKNSDASTKHMIIISDGDPQPPSDTLLQEYIDNKITVSTVAVFPHGTQTQTMQMIASLTGGRFYFPQDPALLPSIFVKEAKTLRRSMIQNKTFTPTVNFPSAILKGIEQMPALQGYVLTTPKPRSTTILDGPEEEEEDPVLSTWRYGVGKTAAFTSDLSPNWAANWMQWDRYLPFVKQLITDISRVNRPGSLRLQSFAEGNVGNVIVEDYADDASFLEVRTQVNGPDDKTHNVTLEQTGPRRYEGKFDLWGEGRYQVMAVGASGSTDDDRNERAHGGFVVPYSNEYLRFKANPIVLKELADQTGDREAGTQGRILTGADTETGEFIFGIPREVRQSSKPIFDWLLILLACLIPLDVAWRRVHLDRQVIMGWFGIGRTAPSQETFTNLLKRKKAVETTLRGKTEQPLAPRPKAGGFPTAGAVSSTPKPDAPKSKPPAADTDAPQSTTERLLALKRKRADDDNEPSDDKE